MMVAFEVLMNNDQSLGGVIELLYCESIEVDWYVSTIILEPSVSHSVQLFHCHWTDLVETFIFLILNVPPAHHSFDLDGSV